MDEAIINYYRNLLKEDFPNSGELDCPSIFIEAVGEKLINCGNTGNYMQLYLQVRDQRITNISYLCSCEPVANVAVEILCTLLKGKTLDEAVNISEDLFYILLNSQEEKLRHKVRGLLELLIGGIANYRSACAGGNGSAKGSNDRDAKLSWDGTSSS
jgi:NifU-like protein involved in Fe-S cluster formation